MNCLLRAHFLTAETPDTFFVIIDRRIFPSVSEIHSLFRNRTAFDTDAAADTFIWLDIWFFLKNIQSLCETLPHTGPCHSPVHIKIWIAILGSRISHGDRTIRCENLNLFFLPCSKSHFFSVIVCRHHLRLHHQHGAGLCPV